MILPVLHSISDHELRSNNSHQKTPLSLTFWHGASKPATSEVWNSYLRVLLFYCEYFLQQLELQVFQAEEFQ